MNSVKWVEIKYGGKVIAVANVKEGTPNEYAQALKAATQNLNNLIIPFKDRIQVMDDELGRQKKEIKKLKGE